VSEIRITHIGGPTALIEAAGRRLLTDPTFDPAGGEYKFGWGTGSRKTTAPALAADSLMPIDAVLLSHDQHDDNLDAAGRELLPLAGRVLTTTAGARRLGGNAQGLEPWQSAQFDGIQITATPCRHGPPVGHRLSGDVVGFALRWPGQQHGALWVTGDTVLYGALKTVPERIDVGTVLIHLGGVRFPITGPARYTMTAGEAIELCTLLRPRTIIPIHYEGWAHFREGREAAGAAFSRAPAEVRDAVRWLEPGRPATIGC
jgi:L-ascorbate metabolism protein UlaG (beta-lactamase superfamily)